MSSHGRCNPQNMPQAKLTSKSQVNLVGLGESPLRHDPSDLRSVMCLHIFLREPSDLFQSFCSCLRQEFSAAGLAIRTPTERDNGGLAFRQARALDTKGLGSGIPKTKPKLKGFGLELRPRFDARDLCEKFRDVVWAKDVHLDRVCISEFLPENIFEDGQIIGVRHRDIVSIPLPGVTWEPRSFEPLRIPYQSATAESQGRDRA